MEIAERAMESRFARGDMAERAMELEFARGDMAERAMELEFARGTWLNGQWSKRFLVVAIW